MLRDRQARQPVDKWMDRLAPKVAEMQAALKQVRPEEIAWRSGAALEGDRLHLAMLFQPYEVDAASFLVIKPDGQPRRKLNTSKAEQEFGFVAKKDFREGIRETIQWYTQQRKGSG